MTTIDDFTATVDAAAAYERFHAVDYTEQPDAADVFSEVNPERTEDNACPECPTGAVVIIGYEHDTNSGLYHCTDCNFSS